MGMNPQKELTVLYSLSGLSLHLLFSQESLERGSSLMLQRRKLVLQEDKPIAQLTQPGKDTAGVGWSLVFLFFSLRQSVGFSLYSRIWGMLLVGPGGSPCAVEQMS